MKGSCERECEDVRTSSKFASKNKTLYKHVLHTHMYDSGVILIYKLHVLSIDKTL